LNKKNAVVLLNLGGPDNLSSVRNFLFNLFYDPNIISLINPFRWLLAKYLSLKRYEKAQEIYAKMGGGSTILPITLKQAQLLEIELEKDKTQKFKVFTSMRYWHPFASEVIKKLEEFSPDEILLLPLYPQFSTTTTKSSLDEFSDLLKKSSLKSTSLKSVCCYYNDPDFITAHVNLIKKETAKIKGKYRLLFSAHGLPEKIIKKGDPYQFQIEETCSKIVEELKDSKLDHVICYQSKVGPLKWIGPSTEEEIIKAAEENIAVIIAPIAFVSDHSETLVELDLEYKELFSEKSSKSYIRVPALNYDKNFIQALVKQTRSMQMQDTKKVKNGLKLANNEKKCEDGFSSCFCR
jgi:protoporphyrin/coproporphyrin ferrochelatase